MWLTLQRKNQEEVENQNKLNNMKFILIAVALAAAAFFIAKKLKAKKEEVVKAPTKPTVQPAPVKKKPVKKKPTLPAGEASLSESNSNGDYYRKPRKAQK